MSETETITVQGNPYYILETNTGIFHAVKGIKQNDNGWSHDFNEDIGELVLGKEIIEVPNKNISLIVRIPKSEFIAPYLIKTLRDYAQISWHDYTALERFGRYATTLLKNEGVNDVYEIKPRLFKKSR